ncbi:MAG: uroporphyrinogen-III synthase [Ignavibacteriaceae bacterium]|jgi:uroporphyrinogen-III synthase
METLKNKTIVLTTAEEQSKETINFFKNIGANLLTFPSLQVVLVDASTQLQTILEESKIDYLVFQSANAIKYFAQLVKEKNLDINYETMKVACYGKKTAALCSQNQIKVDLVPDDFSAKGLLKLFSQESLENKTILLPGSPSVRDEFYEDLKRLGAKIKPLTVYDIQKPEKETITGEIEKIKTGSVDWYLFTSPVTFQNFVELLDITNPTEFFNNSKIAAIGPNTKEALQEAKVRVDIISKKFALTHAIANIEKFALTHTTANIEKFTVAPPPQKRQLKKPKNHLKNRTIVLTRAEEQSQETINFFKKKEANLISFPALEVVPVDAEEKLKTILAENKIDYLVFQSANAIKYFLQLVKEKNFQIDYTNIKVACVGKKTASVCAENQIKVDLVPEDFSALGLLKLFAIEPLENKVVLLPRSAIGRDEFREGLKRFGATVKTVSVYDILIPKKESITDIIEKIRTTKIDWYLFTSPSTYQNFLALMEITKPREFFAKSKIAAIGPTTKDAIEKTRVWVDVVPPKFTVTHAIASIDHFYTIPLPKKKFKSQFQPKQQQHPQTQQHSHCPTDKKVIRYVLKKRKPRNEN